MTSGEGEESKVFIKAREHTGKTRCRDLVIKFMVTFMERGKRGPLASQEIRWALPSLNW